jgi:hypothetical protein
MLTTIHVSSCLAVCCQIVVLLRTCEFRRSGLKIVWKLSVSICHHMTEHNAVHTGLLSTTREDFRTFMESLLLQTGKSP